jgi:hypothetical protein
MAMMLIMRWTKKYRGLEGLGVRLLSIASFLYTLFYFYILYSASCIWVYTLLYPSDPRWVYTLPVSFTDTTWIYIRRILIEIGGTYKGNRDRGMSKSNRDRVNV